MRVKIINLKAFRESITSLWKEARDKNIKYIVLHHSKPILEVYPSAMEELSFEDSGFNDDYYKTLESNLDFWNSKDDEAIFKE